MQTDKEKIEKSFPTVHDMFKFQENGHISGINRDHGFLINRNMLQIISLIAGMIDQLNYDLRGDIATQERLGSVLIDLINEWKRSGWRE